MMSLKLTLHVPFMSDELATDYCARLAVRNFRSASAFALDMGFNFSNLARGSETAIAKLAEVSGEPMALLNGNLLRRLSTDRYDLKGQLLTRSTLRLSNFACCPVCLKEDTETCDLPAAAAMRYRMHWMLASVGTCDKHHVVLQDIGDRYTGSARTGRRNWSDVADSLVPKLSSLAMSAVERPPSQLETYLIDRLYNAQSTSWIDQLDFFVADQAVRWFGAVAKFGRRVNVDELSEDELYAAGEAGFQIVKDGACSIPPFLSDLERGFKRDAKRMRQRQHTPAMIFGRVYKNLRRLKNDPAYSPLRNIVTDHSLSHFAIGPGDMLFGTDVQVRRVHSIQTLSTQFKLSKARVQKVLTAGGLLPRPGSSDETAVVDAAKAEDLIRSQPESMTLRQALAHLNVPGKVMYGLVEHDVIHRHKQSSGPHGYRFLVSELNAFLGTLLSDAVPVDPDTKEVLSLSDAAQRVKTSVHEIACLIRNRGLKWVGYRTDLSGVRSIVVNAEDVADALKQLRPQTLNSFAAASRLNVSPAAVRYLVKERLLVGVWRRDPVSHRMRLFFEAPDVEQFDRTYVSLYNLGRLSGRSTAKIKIELAEKSILPVTEASGVTTIYRRSDLDD